MATWEWERIFPRGTDLGYREPIPHTWLTLEPNPYTMEIVQDQLELQMIDFSTSDIHLLKSMGIKP
jgi:hypothetical protein